MRRVQGRIRPVQPSPIILLLLQPALRLLAMRVLATRRRLGQRMWRRPSQRRLSRRQPSSHLLLPYPVLSLQQLQETGPRRNERKALVGFALRFQPTYAPANVGHPSR
jgi:hypothetical protein